MSDDWHDEVARREAFGRFFREELRTHAISCAEVARRLDMHLPPGRRPKRQQVWRWSKPDPKKPSAVPFVAYDHLVALARVLGWSRAKFIHASELLAGMQLDGRKAA
jgi:hypothetical protein